MRPESARILLPPNKQPPSNPEQHRRRQPALQASMVFKAAMPRCRDPEQEAKLGRRMPPLSPGPLRAPSSSGGGGAAGPSSVPVRSLQTWGPRPSPCCCCCCCCSRVKVSHLIRLGGFTVVLFLF
ncbi:unnamed protein product [Merluccius merluccius]